MLRPLVLPLLLLVLVALVAVAAPAQAQGPAASFAIEPRFPNAGDEVTFTSTAQPGNATIVQWDWNFGDGTTASGPEVRHTFAAGDVLVTLVVTDSLGQTGQTSVPLSFPEPPSTDEVEASGLPAWLFWLMPFLVALMLFAMAYLVVAKGQPAIYNQVFLFFYATSGVKSLSEAFAALLVGSSAAVTLETVNRVAAYLLVALFLWFVLVFPRPVVGWLRDGRRGAVVLGLAVPFLVLDFAGLVDLGRQVNLFNTFAVAVAVLSLGLLYWHSRETDSLEERLRIRWLAFTFLLLVASAIVLTALNLVYSAAAQAGDAERAQALATLSAVTGLVVVPALEIVGAVILLYAILRYQLLGIEGLVLRITRGAVVALTVPSLFIIIGNSVEAVFEATVLTGLRFSFIIAGFMSALLMIPVQKWVTFLLHRWLPGLDREEAATAARRREIFEAQLRYCLLDGALKPKEVRSLQRLVRELDMPRDEMVSIARRFGAANTGALLA